MDSRQQTVTTRPGQEVLRFFLGWRFGGQPKGSAVGMGRRWLSWITRGSPLWVWSRWAISSSKDS